MSEASESSPPTYTIRHVRDLVDIPPDRLEDCLGDIRLAVESYRETREIVIAMAETMAKADGTDVTIDPAIFDLPEITWIDDGERVARPEFVEMSEKGEHPQ